MSEPAAEFIAGDRVTTPGSNLATVLQSPWQMPLHTLVQVDAGAKLWVLTNLLQPTDGVAPTQPAQRKPKRSRR